MDVPERPIWLEMTVSCLDLRSLTRFMIETEKDIDKSRSFDSDIAFSPWFFSEVCRFAASDVFAYGKSDVAPDGRSDVMCF